MLRVYDDLCLIYEAKQSPNYSLPRNTGGPIDLQVKMQPFFPPYVLDARDNNLDKVRIFRGRTSNQYKAIQWEGATEESWNGP